MPAVIDEVVLQIDPDSEPKAAPEPEQKAPRIPLTPLIARELCRLDERMSRLRAD